MKFADRGIRLFFWCGLRRCGRWKTRPNHQSIGCIVAYHDQDHDVYMNFAPNTVFAAMCSVITTKVGSIKTYAVFMGEFYVGLFVYGYYYSCGFVVLKKNIYAAEG